MHTTWNQTPVLVTGGAGFIGSFLVERLVALGADVVVADNLSRGGADKLAAVVDQVELRPVDLTTMEGCLRATEGVEVVFHLAASVGGVHYIERENVGGLTPSVLMNQHVLEACRIRGIDRLVFASSACIYRQRTDDLNEFSEDQGYPAHPFSTYGWAKVLGEVACKAYHDDYGMQTVSARIFNAYGPRESLDPDSSHVIPSLCRKVIEAPDGGSIEIFGDGTQERGFIYVTDLVDGLVRAAEVKGDGGVVNIGNAHEVVSIADLAARVIAISGKELQIEHDLSGPTGTNRYCADMTTMKKELNWEPTVSLDDGLKRVYDWAADELGAKRPVLADGGDR
ncbi:nucleoside-diphosphate sugar epimerase [Salinigranum rubrum]|uniref:Nucleoside-diphosphate sugar epimerase n=1 Tax=Salinigranum rubrum TaxID=755307 RepID=A0A2I8VP27_9EURY|nr:NAD-dependent epimerase/dehydratase family protein [Salinigranum rubrum]AUV82869.1 nucleoside-diphosphate sugar epimerase [Salinigranum rubrum]